MLRGFWFLSSSLGSRQTAWVCLFAQLQHLAHAQILTRSFYGRVKYFGTLSGRMADDFLILLLWWWFAIVMYSAPANAVNESDYSFQNVAHFLIVWLSIHRQQCDIPEKHIKHMFEIAYEFWIHRSPNCNSQLIHRIGCKYCIPALCKVSLSCDGGDQHDTNGVWPLNGWPRK